MAIQGMTPSIYVKDLDASLHFYRDLLGLTMRRPIQDSRDNRPMEEYHERLFNIPKMHYRLATLVSEGTPVAIELFQFVSPVSKPKPKNYHWTDIGYIALMFRIPDVNAIYQDLKSRGVKFVAPPAIRPTGGGNVLAYDPDGNVIMLSQPPPQPS